MRTFFLVAGLVSLSLACGGSVDSDVADDELVGKGPNVHLTILESKLVYDSRPESFVVQVPRSATTLELPCREGAFAIWSEKSLFEGWSVAKAADFFQTDNADYKDYTFASCRDDKTEVIAWFAKEREYELLPSEQMLSERYKPSELPLSLRVKTLGAAAATYYSCASMKKAQVGETENSKKFDVSMACKPIGEPTAKEIGPIDFLENPGPFAAQLSYDSAKHPSLASNATNFARVQNALLAEVAAGKYAGAMSTLSKTCGLEVQSSKDSLVIEHTIESSGRTRRLEFKPEDLLGFLEGDLYADVNRISGEPVGRFASAEFRDAKNGTIAIRFEDNTTLDKKIVRINGSEAYCRRLVPAQ